jgi:hypothetical protein
MLRRGIPYGPLTKNEEKAGGVSQAERGLLFVSYQSSIRNGFHTVQKGVSLLPNKQYSTNANHQNGRIPLMVLTIRPTNMEEKHLKELTPSSARLLLTVAMMKIWLSTLTPSLL